MTMTAEPTTVRDFTLAELEGVIESGLMTFFEVGAALQQIRERRLYRETHDTFEAYCQERWSFNRQRASQLIQAAEMSRILDIQPVRASHAEALLPLKDAPELAREVVAEVRDAKGNAATAADYQQAVAQKTGRPVRPAPKPSVVKSASPEAEISQDIPDDLATAGADVDPSHEFPTNNEAPIHAAKAEQWCQACGGKYRGTACPCDGDDEPYPRGADIPCARCGGGILVNTPAMDRALAKVVADGRRNEILCLACPGADDVSWRQAVEATPQTADSSSTMLARRSAISEPQPMRRAGADGKPVIGVDPNPAAITRALFSNATLPEMAAAIHEEASESQYAALVVLLTERLTIDQLKIVVRRTSDRLQNHHIQLQRAAS